ncbi:sulfurtransferase [Diaminobutyricibacter sp. McL0608]|uniref:sulfurtransferase n=1 Tax=Leifsonia sp. McL0608 TaxID=3143537 RepID=UPI0031F316EB
MSQATAGAARTMTQTEVLVSPEWLASRLDDPGIQVVEVDVNAKNFAVGHIRGALLWNVYRDFRNADYSLVEESAIVDLFRRSGLTPDTTVVFYGYAPALAFWMMKLYRHADVLILDGSRDDWQDAGLPWTTDAAVPEASEYRMPAIDASIRATGDEVAALLDDPGTRILDMRTPPEFDGAQFWPSGGMEPGGRAGHIPGATNVSLDGVFDEAGRYRDREALAMVFALEGAEPTRMITYCTVGGRGSTAWFVLTYLLGRSGVKVHDGGWAEWGKDPARPVAA